MFSFDMPPQCGIRLFLTPVHVAAALTCADPEPDWISCDPRSQPARRANVSPRSLRGCHELTKRLRATFSGRCSAE